jgi:hypothetical protein
MEEGPRERLDLFLADNPAGADPGLYPWRLLACLSWLHEHLGERRRSGAHLRRRLFRRRASHSDDNHLDAVRGGIAISGLYDLEQIRLNYINEKLRLDEAEAPRNSPRLNFPPMAGPLIVSYGTAELPELSCQSIDYAETGSSAGYRGVCCRSTGPTTLRSSKRWPSQTGSSCRLYSPWCEAEA